MNGQDMKQFLDGVVDLGKKSSGFEVKDVPGAPEHLMFVYNHATGVLETREKTPAVHSPKAATPLDLLDLIGSSKGKFKPGDRAAVVVAPERLTYYPDHDDQRFAATSPLRFTPQFKWFLQYGGQQIDQKSLIRTLRVTLGDAVPEGVLNGIRQVNWTATTDGNVQNHSLGKSVHQAMTSTAGVPDEVVVTLPVYIEMLAAKFSFRCYVEVEADHQKFRLTPFPGEFEAAQVDAQRLVAKVFEKAKTQVIVTGT